MLEAPIVTKIKENKKIIITAVAALFAFILLLIIIFSGGDESKKKVSPQASVQEAVETPAQEPPLWQEPDTDATISATQPEESAGMTMPAAQEAEAPVDDIGTTYQTYIVSKGDALIKIAKKFYGSSHYWTQIFDKNKAAIKDPDLIFIGQKIVVPVRSDGNLSWNKKLVIDSYIETYKSYRKQEKLEQVYWLLLEGVKRVDPELKSYYLAEVKKFDRAFARGELDEQMSGETMKTSPYPSPSSF